MMQTISISLDSNDFPGTGLNESRNMSYRINNFMSVYADQQCYDICWTIVQAKANFIVLPVINKIIIHVVHIFGYPFILIILLYQFVK